MLALASWFLTPRIWVRAFLFVGHRFAGLSSQIVRIDGLHWHFLRGGRGPTILMLHGFGADANCWIRLAPLLRSRFTMLIPDLPGFGKSEPPDGIAFDIDSQRARLVSFLNAVGIDDCIVVGNSMGGYLATALAAAEPARVSALWLLAPLGVTAVEPGWALREIDKGDLEYLQVESVQQLRDRIVPNMFARPPWIPGPLAKELVDIAGPLREHGPRMLEQVRRQSEPLESIARRVEQDVLIQWGEDDRVVNPEGLAVLGQSFRSATCALTANCGHLPMLEKPRESARLFFGFLRDRQTTKSQPANQFT